MSDDCPRKCDHRTFHYCGASGTHCDKHCVCSCRLCVAARPVPLELTLDRYWEELEKLGKIGIIPPELGMMLKALVTTHLRETIPPEATRYLTTLAMSHLQGGIQLDDHLYDVAVFVPNSGDKVATRSFFKLIPKYPGGWLKYLKDI